MVHGWFAPALGHAAQEGGREEPLTRTVPDPLDGSCQSASILSVPMAGGDQLEISFCAVAPRGGIVEFPLRRLSDAFRPLADIVADAKPPSAINCLGPSWPQAPPLRSRLVPGAAWTGGVWSCGSVARR